MKVKIGNQIYDADNTPIMLVLDDFDKDYISNMGDQTKYCRFPEGTKVNEIANFMKISVNVPDKLFEFDIEDKVRKDMPGFLMRNEGVTEKEAIEETEKIIKSSKDITNFCEQEIENLKCNFANKVSFNIDDVDKKLGTPLVTKTIDAVWTPKQGPVNIIDMVSIIEEKYGLIPGETKKDKVDWIREKFIMDENMNFTVKQKEE